MAELLGATMPALPTFGLSSGGTLIALSVVVFLIAASIILYMVMMWRTYNKKIIIFENIGGVGWRKTGQDSARMIKLGDGGEELLYL